MASLFRASCSSPLQFRSEEDVRWCAATQTNLVFIVIATVAIFLAIGFTLDKDKFEKNKGRGPRGGPLTIRESEQDKVNRAIRESKKNKRGGALEPYVPAIAIDSHWSWRF